MNVLRVVLFLTIAYSISQGIFDAYTVTGAYPDDHLIFFQNYSIHHGIVFGRDTLNTYGPLGFLLHPLAYENNLALAVCFRLTVWCLSLCLLYFIVDNGGGKRAGIAPLALLAAVLFFTFDYTYVFGTASKNWEKIIYNNNITFFIIITAYAALVTRSRRQDISFLILSFFFAVLTLTKFQYCVMTGACLVYALGISAVLHRGHVVRNAVWALLGVGLAIPLYAFLFQDASNLLLFLRGSLEITSGYSETVSLQGPPSEVVAAILLMVLFAATLVTHTKNTPYVSVYILGLFFCYIFFKHAFTRHDSHSTSFYVCFAVLTSATALVSRSKVSSALLALATIASLAVLFASTKILCIHSGKCESFVSDRVVSKFQFQYTRGIFDVEKLLHPNYFHGCALTKLCPEILEAIGQQKTSLWTLNLCSISSTGINFVPFYIYQQYNDYTPYLDAMTAAKLNDPETMPQYVIFHFDPIDDRNPFMDSQIAMEALVEKYDDNELCGMHLFKRKANTIQEYSFVEIENLITLPEVNVDVPALDSDVYVSVHLEYTLFGKLWTAILHLPPIYMIMVDENNHECKTRISPKPIRSPFLMNRVPRTKEQFSKYLKGEEFPKIIQFKLKGPGLQQFKGSIGISFYTKVASEAH